MTSLSSMNFFAPPLLLVLAFSVTASENAVRHDLTVRIQPHVSRIEVEDRIQLPMNAISAARSAEFFLNAAFEPELVGAGALLEAVESPGTTRLRRYRLQFTDDSRQATLSYSGRLAQAAGAYDFGHLGSLGVFLTGTGAWYPLFDDALVTFSMRVAAPRGWIVVSQGNDDSRAGELAPYFQVWREARPQTNIVLIAGQFTLYKRKTANIESRVYLRQPDPEMADRYLRASEQYLALYQRLLGSYPYDKFALVENFWETGYGMASLAVLGPRVIRFPFILHSSFPHEILHNWWGNGVYVDRAGGNWSEGLTAYLADHLVQERRGRGADYRRAALQKFASYVDEVEDFPLSAFRGKHGEVSQAVGYNKALMFFHMLRRRLGDEQFLNALRKFASRHRFDRADYADLRRAFEATAGVELAPEFNQWIERTGAPLLRLSDVRVDSGDEGHRVIGVIAQEQPGAPYRLYVPIAVQLVGHAYAMRTEIFIDSKREQFELDLPARPVSLHVDPEFDLFRRLAPGEAPVSLGDLLGADDPLFIVPAGDSDVAQAYGRLGRSLGGRLLTDDKSQLLSERAVWLLGWENAHLEAFVRLMTEEGVALGNEGVRLGTDEFRRDATCVVMAARSNNDTEHAIGFVGCDNKRAIEGLSRKIPHYGKYGFLAFTGDEPTNVRKEEWPVRDSPLSVVFDREAVRQPPPLSPRPTLAARP